MNGLATSALPAARQVRLFRNGANQALRIPREFELSTENATIRPMGAGLYIEPTAPQYAKGSVMAVLTALAALAHTPAAQDEDFPDVDQHLLPADAVVL